MSFIDYLLFESSVHRKELKNVLNTINKGIITREEYFKLCSSPLVSNFVIIGSKSDLKNYREHSVTVKHGIISETYKVLVREE